MLTISASSVAYSGSRPRPEDMQQRNQCGS
jgi:hypothetical protein